MSQVDYYKVKSEVKDYFSAYKFSHGLGSPTSKRLEEKLIESLKNLSYAQTKSLYEEFVIQYGLILEGMMPVIEEQDVDAMQMHMPTCHACGKVLDMLETARYDTTDKSRVVKHMDSIFALRGSMKEYSEFCSFNSKRCHSGQERKQFDDIEKELQANVQLKYIRDRMADKINGVGLNFGEVVIAQQEYDIMQRTIARYSEKLKKLPRSIDFMYYEQDNAALQRFINKIRNYAFVQVDKYNNPQYGILAISDNLRNNVEVNNLQI